MGRVYTCVLRIVGPDVSNVVDLIGTPDIPYDPARVRDLIAGLGVGWGVQLDDKGTTVKEDIATPVYLDGQRKTQQIETVEISFDAKNSFPGDEIVELSTIFPDNDFELVVVDEESFERDQVFAIKNGDWKRLDTRDYYLTHSLRSPEEIEARKKLDEKYQVEILTDVFAGDSSTTGTILIDGQKWAWDFTNRWDSLQANEEAYSAVVRALHRPLIRGVKKQAGTFPRPSSPSTLDYDPQTVAEDAADDDVARQDESRKTGPQEDIFVPAPLRKSEVPEI